MSCEWYEIPVKIVRPEEFDKLFQQLEFILKTIQCEFSACLTDITEIDVGDTVDFKQDKFTPTFGCLPVRTLQFLKGAKENDK